MGNRLRTTYYTRKVALVNPVCTTIPGTDNLQEYNIVSYTMLGNKRYVRYNHGSWALEYVYNPEGYIKYWGEEEHYPYYYIKDHLGSVRETYIRPYSTEKYCEQRMQYYPSGLPWNTNLSSSYQPFKYGGKEFVEMHGFDIYEYEARGYYATIMRFTAMDPLCEQTPWQSPYVYAANNPVCNVDWMGLSAFTMTSAGIFINSIGRLSFAALEEGDNEDEDEWVDMSEEDEKTTTDEDKKALLTALLQELFVLPINNAWEYLTDNDRATVYLVLLEFFLQCGPEERDFSETSLYTQEFKTDLIVLLRPYIKMMIAIHSGETSGEFNHDLGDFFGLYGIPFFIKDILTILPNHYRGNLYSTAIGSFSGEWQLINDGKDIQISISNPMSMRSLLRLPFVGYSDWWKDNIYPIVDMLNYNSKSQTITWTVPNLLY